MQLTNELRAVARLLVQGQIGLANSRYAALLGGLAGQLDSLHPEERRDVLRALQAVSQCQKQEDWVGMADALEFGLSWSAEEKSQ